MVVLNALAPLVCAQCAAPVPLADGDFTVCPFCAARVAIPPRYQALRVALHDGAADRGQAAKLYARIGRTPSLLLRICAALFSPGSLALWLFWASAIIGLLLVLGALTLADWVLPFNPFDVWSDQPLDRWSAVFGVGLAWAGGIAGMFGRRHALDLRELQAALSATPPARAGGPSTCRVCGAPLAVLPNALGARCDYCGADNLVAVNERWIAGARKTARTLESAMAHALRANADETRRTRRQVLIFAALMTAASALFIGVLLASMTRTWVLLDPGYAKAVKTHRVIERTDESDHPGGLSYEYFRPRTLPASGRIDFSIVPFECGFSPPCVHRFYVPLRRGELLHVIALDAPADARLEIGGHVGGGLDLSSRDVGKDHAFSRAPPLPFSRALPLTVFAAPRSAWYRLVITSSAPGAAAMALSIE